MGRIGLDINVETSGIGKIKSLSDSIHALGVDLTEIQNNTQKPVSSGANLNREENNHLGVNGQNQQSKELLDGFLGKEVFFELNENTRKIVELLQSNFGVEDGKGTNRKNKFNPDEIDPNFSKLKKIFKSITGKNIPISELVGSIGGKAFSSALSKIVTIAKPLAVAALAIKTVTGIVTAGFNASMKMRQGRVEGFDSLSNGNLASGRKSLYESSLEGQLNSNKIVGVLTLGISSAIDSYRKNQLGKEEAIEKLYSNYGNHVPALLEARGKTGLSTKSLLGIGGTASRYGYDLNTALSIKSILAENGSFGGTGKTLSFARQFGVDPSMLAGFYGQANLLGRGKNNEDKTDSLDYVGGTLTKQGMGRGRFKEMMEAFSSVFTSSLSDGVVKTFADISSSFNFLASGGETWKGKYGARKIEQIDSVFKGATELKTDRDVMLYQALRGEGDSYWDVAKKLEKGMTPKNLEAYTAQLWSETGGNSDDIKHKIKSTFGFSATDTSTFYDMLLKARDTGDYGKASKTFTSLSKTTEEKTLSVIEEIKMDTVKMSADLKEVMGQYYAQGYVQSVGDNKSPQELLKGQAEQSKKDAKSKDRGYLFNFGDLSQYFENFSLLEIANIQKYLSNENFISTTYRGTAGVSTDSSELRNNQRAIAQSRDENGTLNFEILEKIAPDLLNYLNEISEKLDGIREE